MNQVYGVFLKIKEGSVQGVLNLNCGSFSPAAFACRFLDSVLVTAGSRLDSLGRRERGGETGGWEAPPLGSGCSRRCGRRGGRTVGSLMEGILARSQRTWVQVQVVVVGLCESYTSLTSVKMRKTIPMLAGL